MLRSAWGDFFALVCHDALWKRQVAHSHKDLLMSLDPVPCPLLLRSSAHSADSHYNGSIGGPTATHARRTCLQHIHRRNRKQAENWGDCQALLVGVGFLGNLPIGTNTNTTRMMSNERGLQQRCTTQRGLVCDHRHTHPLREGTTEQACCNALTSSPHGDQCCCRRRFGACEPHWRGTAP